MLVFWKGWDTFCIIDTGIPVGTSTDFTVYFAQKRQNSGHLRPKKTELSLAVICLVYNIGCGCTKVFRVFIDVFKN